MANNTAQTLNLNLLISANTLYPTPVSPVLPLKQTESLDASRRLCVKVGLPATPGAIHCYSNSEGGIKSNLSYRFGGCMHLKSVFGDEHHRLLRTELVELKIIA